MVELQNTYWIGGAPCGGKSSVAEILAAELGGVAYHADDFFEKHSAEAPQKSILRRIASMAREEIFLRPTDEMLADFIELGREEFPMILRDVKSLSIKEPKFVEGNALLPECLARLEGVACVYIVPTEEFQRKMYAKRKWVDKVLEGISNKTEAMENWRTRDAAFADFIASEARRFNFPLIKVDGTQNLIKIAEQTRIKLGIGV